MTVSQQEKRKRTKTKQEKAKEVSKRALVVTSKQLEGRKSNKQRKNQQQLKQRNKLGQGSR